MTIEISRSLMTDDQQAAIHETCGLPHLILFLLLMLSVQVSAQGVSPRQASYIRTHFSTENGFTSSQVDDIIQSHEGFLWLRVEGGFLTRFDGQHFRVSDQLRPVRSLALAPNGDLWFANKGSVNQVNGGDLGQLSGPPSASYRLPSGALGVVLHFTREGVLWVGTDHGLYRLEHKKLAPAIEGPYIERIEEAANRHFWITTRTGLMEWDGVRAIAHPEVASQLGIKAEDLFHVLEDSHGVLWFCTANGVARRAGGNIEKLSPWGTHGHATTRVYEDPRGRMWFAREEGLFQLAATGLIEPVAPGMQVRRMYGDRDGNLWVGTNGDGLYRFREAAGRTYTTADGLPNNVAMTVLAAHDGSLWTGFNCGGISRFDGRSFRTYNEKDGLSNSCVWSLAEDARHDLWIGTWGGGLFRDHNGIFTQYSDPQGLPGSIVTSVVAARDGTVWFVGGSEVGRIRNGQVRNYTSADGLSYDRYIKVYEDRSGGIWLGSTQGIEHLVGDRFQRFVISGALGTRLLGEDSVGALYFGEQWSPGALQRIFRVLKDRPIQVVSAPSGEQEVRETKQGDVWLFSRDIRRFPPGSLEQVYRRDEPADYETFGSQDGLPSSGVNSADPASAMTPDGKLWFATTQGLASLDLPRISRAEIKPTIYVEQILVGRNAQTPLHELILPAGTHHLELNFNAIDITSPEKIRLQYRMDGVDSEWLDASPSARSVYNALPPGKHAFHMRATNRNGIWDRTGTVYYITQRPYFYQTTWFLAFCIATGLLVVWAVYRVRVKQVAKAIGARFDERLSERTRIARELHDTLLQTIQGSKLVADSALKQSSDSSRMHEALAQLSVWLGRATEEGRAALNSLRTSTSETNDLAEAFRRAIKECRLENSMEASFSVVGDVREMHPIVRDEVYRIGYEAIRNACVHSQASKLQVILTYAEELGVRVTDNGVGIDPLVLDHGKEGHFGLQGMRERAARIAGKLIVTGSPSSGTEIRLVVPGNIIYRKTTSHSKQQYEGLN
jgi:signal transduction histidine kinase/ligand-binding sensor domain-containing protein